LTAPATASQPLPGDEIATSRGITMPHFAIVLNTSKEGSASVAKLAPRF